VRRTCQHVQAGPSVADIDRRKARIVACLHPTRTQRGFRTREDVGRLGAMLGVSRSTFQAWDDGATLPKDAQLPGIEQWLSSGPVWRYAGVERVTGPEEWPQPLNMPFQVLARTQETGFISGQATEPATERGGR